MNKDGRGWRRTSFDRKKPTPYATRVGRVYLGMPRDLVHPTDPVVGVSPQGDHQGVVDILASGARLHVAAHPFPVLNVLVNAILKPVLDVNKQQKKRKKKGTTQIKPQTAHGTAVQQVKRRQFGWAGDLDLDAAMLWNLKMCCQVESAMLGDTKIVPGTICCYGIENIHLLICWGNFVHSGSDLLSNIKYPTPSTRCCILGRFFRLLCSLALALERNAPGVPSRDTCFHLHALYDIR